MGNKIFISHATADAELVNEFVDFLQTAFNIGRQEIYCTSGHGTKKIRTGFNFITDMRENIHETELVMLFLTPNYFKRPFCMAELGAAWALGGEVYPILIPPISHANLESTPLKGIQVLTLRSEDDLIHLGDEIKDRGIISELNMAHVIVKSRNFMKQLPNLCHFTEDTTVSLEEFRTIKVELQTMMDMNVEQASEIKELEEKIKEIKKLKSTEEVMVYEKQHSREWDNLEKLIEDVSIHLEKLDTMVISALYYDKCFNSDYGYWPDQGADWGVLRQLHADKYIIIDQEDHEITPNYADYDIKSAVNALDELQYYIENDSTHEVHTLFSKEYKINLDFDSKRFWEKLFNVTINVY